MDTILAVELWNPFGKYRLFWAQQIGDVYLNKDDSVSGLLRIITHHNHIVIVLVGH